MKSHVHVLIFTATIGISGAKFCFISSLYVYMYMCTFLHIDVEEIFPGGEQEQPDKRVEATRTGDSHAYGPAGNLTQISGCHITQVSMDGVVMAQNN